MLGNLLRKKGRTEGERQTDSKTDTGRQTTKSKQLDEQAATETDREIQTYRT